MSPYGLKVDALLRQAGLSFKWLPEQGTAIDGIRAMRRISAVKSGRAELTWPPADPLREFPLVPFLLGPDGENLYDSSAIGEWLQRRNPQLHLLPPADTAAGFLVRLVDEALDEFGLYMVHHNRWVNAAADNAAGKRLAAEFKPLLGPLTPLYRFSFPPRQVRRLPYLFSVADETAQFQHLPRRLRPPRRAGFPPTHALLDQAFAELLEALEPVIAQRPYLFGEAMSLADASVFGQIGMNYTDRGAWRMVVDRAPHTAQWIERHYLRAPDRGAAGQPVVNDDLKPILAWCCRYFVPLMQQNERAYRRYIAEGETLFNEAAFDRDRALYDGALASQPFRAVVKTFQVKVWRDLLAQWHQLDDSARRQVHALLPPGTRLEQDDVE